MAKTNPAARAQSRGPSRSEHAKAKAAALRETARKRQRNRRIGVAAVMLLVIAAVIGVVVQSQRSSSGRSNLVVSPSAKGPGGSMLLGSPTAPVLVEEYGDFQCPHCGEFEKTTYPTILQLVNQGKIRFAFHFFTFIGPESFALANTSICAADQGKFWPVHDYFYANQHPENSGYWTTARLIDVLKQFGVDNPTSEQCVRNHTYYPWLRQLADQASQRGVTATPAIFVNGTQLDDTSPAGLIAAVNSQTKSG